MIDVLKNIESKVAAGVLARTTLSLQDVENPASKYAFDGEAELRAAIIEEIRERLNIESADFDEEEIGRLIDILDEEMEEHQTAYDADGVLNAMGDEGRLPSDAYTVSFAEPVKELYKRRWIFEEYLIRSAIIDSDSEAHIGGAPGGDVKNSISLFSKRFKSKFPYRNFCLILVCQRHGLNLIVAQVWHAYENSVPIKDDDSPLEMFKKFCDVFGYDLIYKGERAKLIFKRDEAEVDNKLTVNIDGQPGLKTGNLTHFKTRNPDSLLTSTLASAIDTGRYKIELKAHGWADEVKIIHASLLKATDAKKYRPEK